MLFIAIAASAINTDVCFLFILLMPNCCCRQIYLFVVYVRKGNTYIVSNKTFSHKKVIYMLSFNVFIQNTYVYLHLFTNSILLCIIIYKAVFLVPVVLFSMVPGGWCHPWFRWLPPWFQWWRCLHGGWCPRCWWCLPGSSGGGAFMVAGVLVAGGASLVPVV